MEMEKKLMQYLQGKEHIYIYGAGIYAGRFSRRMQKYGLYPEGYIVTEKKDNPSDINGKKVWEAKELAGCGADFERMIIIVAIAGSTNVLAENLMDLGYKNILLFPHKLFCEIRGRELAEAYNKCADDYIVDCDYPDMEELHMAAIEKRTGCALFRTRCDDFKETVFREKCRREVFEQVYGFYDKLPYTRGEGNETQLLSKGIEVYVATSHLNKQKEIGWKEDEGLIPIQAGAALTSIRMGCLTDDTGVHISGENQNYCECTALYWIWKNTVGQKYAGLCQYRRKLRLTESGVRYIKEQDIDAVAVLPQFNCCTNKKFFEKYGLRHDWQYMKEAVVQYDKAYEAVMERYERSHFFIPCNMVIFKREWLDKYCEFAFSVASMIDRRYREALVVPREDRYMGYLFENLLSIFLIRNHAFMKVAYTDMVFI